MYRNIWQGWPTEPEYEPTEEDLEEMAAHFASLDEETDLDDTAATAA